MFSKNYTFKRYIAEFSSTYNILYLILHVFCFLSPAVRQHFSYRRCLFNNTFDNNFSSVLYTLLVCMAYVL